MRAGGARATSAARGSAAASPLGTRKSAPGPEEDANINGGAGFLAGNTVGVDWRGHARGHKTLSEVHTATGM
eukprot:4982044-Pyramimonas_sp.AAC.1